MHEFCLSIGEGVGVGDKESQQWFQCVPLDDAASQVRRCTCWYAIPSNVLTRDHTLDSAVSLTIDYLIIDTSPILKTKL